MSSVSAAKVDSFQCVYIGSYLYAKSSAYFCFYLLLLIIMSCPGTDTLAMHQTALTATLCLRVEL